MYCRNCGKELNVNEKFCSECGTSTGSAENLGVQENKTSQENMVSQENLNFQGNPNYANSSKGKGIASMVLGILAIYFGLSVVSGASYYEGSGFFFAFGYVLIPLALAIVSNCLGAKERKFNKNGFNLTGLILSYITYGLSFITFFSVL